MVDARIVDSCITLYSRENLQRLSLAKFFSVEIWFEETDHLRAQHEMSRHPRPGRDPQTRKGPERSQRWNQLSEDRRSTRDRIIRLGAKSQADILPRNLVRGTWPFTCPARNESATSPRKGPSNAQNGPKRESDTRRS